MDLQKISPKSVVFWYVLALSLFCEAILIGLMPFLIVNHINIDFGLRLDISGITASCLATSLIYLAIIYFFEKPSTKWSIKKTGRFLNCFFEARNFIVFLSSLLTVVIFTSFSEGNTSVFKLSSYLPLWLTLALSASNALFLYVIPRWIDRSEEDRVFKHFQIQLSQDPKATTKWLLDGIPLNVINLELLFFLEKIAIKKLMALLPNSIPESQLLGLKRNQCLVVGSEIQNPAATLSGPEGETVQISLNEEADHMQLRSCVEILYQIIWSVVKG